MRMVVDLIVAQLPARALVTLRLGMNDPHRGEVRSEPRCIAREQCQRVDSSVRADEEVWKRRPLGATTLAVLHKGLSCEKGGFPRHGCPPKVSARKRYLHRLDLGEAHRDFGIDDSVDQQWPSVSSLGECVCGPAEPIRILGENIEQDIAVYQRAGG